MKKVFIALLAALLLSIPAFADSSTYLNFTAVNGSGSVQLNQQGTPNSVSLQYSTNNGTTWSSYSIGQTIQLSSGSKVYFKATSTNNNFSQDFSSYYYFNMTGTISADGNIMSLLDASMQRSSVPGYAFLALFYGCPITSAPSLPATTLSESCYSYTFCYCTLLTSAPALPATNLADYCYVGIFENCTSLTTPPTLPATNLTSHCYNDMFWNCTSLSSAPSLPATNLAEGCYCGMFYGCSSLTTPPALPATTLEDYCYRAMFDHCTSLTSAPALPATTMKRECYILMFDSCTSLTSAPALPATTLAKCCYAYMFCDCPSLKNAPALPATTLADSCYYGMFGYCSSLVVNSTLPGVEWKIPSGATSATDWNAYMLYGTGGTYTNDPVIGQSYYISSDPSAPFSFVVSYDNNQSYNYRYHGTLSDGVSEVYFYKSGSNWYVTKIATTASSITIPDTLYYNGTAYQINYFGYSSSIDVSNAPNLTELTLPTTMSYISCAIPSTVTDLHLTRPNGYVNLSDSTNVPTTTNVWVPYSSLSYYRNQQVSTSSYTWKPSHKIHYEGWQFRALSVNVPIAGTFSQVMVDSINQWYEVNELTVSGHLNATDYTFFNRLTEMTKLDLSQTDITTIGGLSGLTQLETVILPTSVTNIEANAFDGCKRLRTINMPNVTTFNDYAFKDCWNLVIDNLPSATSIGQYAFYNCDAINNISLPNATSIGTYAFYDCDYLVTASCPSALSINNYCFKECDRLDSIYLPVVTIIGQYAFTNCYNLQHIYCPSVQEIQYEAFWNCSNLQSINLPNVSSIANYSFGHCNSLATVSLSSKLSSLGSSIFSSTTSLRNVYCYATTPVSTNSFPASVASNATLHVPAYSVNSYLASSDWYHFQNIVALDTTVDKLIINTDFILNTQNGLSDTIAMDITETGRLTVNTDSVLRISNYVQICSPLYYSSYYDYNTYSYVYDYSKCSSLITYDTITADTVTFKVSVKANTWNFLSFPVDIDVFDIQVPSGTGWVIRKYSGQDRANLTGNTWQDVTDGMTLNAGQGYIFNCTNSNGSYSNYYVEFTLRALNNSNKNKIFETGNASQFLNSYTADLPHNSGWNLVGNPFPCFFNSDSIQHNGVITVWNGTGYTAYSLIDDNYCFRPFEAFFVQCPSDANAMIFKAGGRTDAYTSPTQTLNAPAMFNTLSKGNNRLVYNIVLSNDSTSDRTRFVLNENASVDYEISCDASKFLGGDNVVPQIYVMENEQRFAIDERPLANGQIDLGVYIAQPGQYTISLMSNLDDETYPILTDKLNGVRTNLANESYKFQATAGYNDERFMITFDKIPADIDNVDSESIHLESGDVFTMDGRLVMHFDSRSELQNLNSGVYVIKSGDLMEKIAIK